MQQCSFELNVITFIYGFRVANNHIIDSNDSSNQYLQRLCNLCPTTKLNEPKTKRKKNENYKQKEDKR